MAYRCAICDCPYLAWSDGLHHDDRLLDLWHDVEVGDLRPQVKYSDLPPEMRPPEMRDSEPQRPPSRR